MHYLRSSSSIHALPNELPDRGELQITALTDRNLPVPDARVSVSFTGDPDQVLEMTQTGSDGRTESLILSTPPIEYSLESSNEIQPYAEYTIRITAPGYETAVINGTQLLSGQCALQRITLRPLESSEAPDTVVIPAHTLYGSYPPKIAEAETKPIDVTGEIVLNEVVIPEFIVVHDGTPRDSSASNYYVRYKDYIKNVASSEIYATWPQASITANVLAIMSFTLNRVYTEHYRNRGHDFTITSSTAFDHKWIPGRNIYESISVIVDEIFDNYLSRPGVRQPILTQYCDGRQVQCLNRGWMTQWGSCSLGERGYSPIEILRHYYGDSLYINTAEEIAGIPSSWPGYDLTIGASGQKVRQLQEQLDAIATVYTAIPRVAADGIYGPATAAAVREFQSIFGLPPTGVTDFATWYKVSHIYVAVSGIGELYGA